MSKDARQYYHVLDLVRFFAALMVVAYHYFALFPRAGHIPASYEFMLPVSSYGAFGVHLFFIISGFVIAMSARGRSAVQFATARAMRLYPAFIACCTLTAVAILIWGAGSTGELTIARYLANVAMLAPYFGQHSLDDAYWSLYLEVRFYVAIAILIAVGLFARIEVFCWAWLGISAFNLFVEIPRGLGILVLEYAGLFVAGIALQRIASLGPSFLRYSLLTAAMVVASIYIWLRAEASVTSSIVISPIVSVAVCLGFCLLMWAVATGRIATQRSALTVALGAISYPLYLLHSEIGIITIRQMSAFVPAPLVAGGTILGMIFLAYAVHLLIERPIEAVRRKLAVSAGGKV